MNWVWARLVLRDVRQSDRPGSGDRDMGSEVYPTKDRERPGLKRFEEIEVVVSKATFEHALRARSLLQKYSTVLSEADHP